MNALIKELAIKANLSIRGHYDELGSTPFELEKFAELIVRECASLSYDGPGAILEHFGVEE